MRVLYFHQYFKLPTEPGGTRSYWIAKELVNRGIKVTMIASKELKGCKMLKCKVDDIDIIYLNVPYSQSMSLLVRIRSWLKYAILSLIESRNHRNVDLAIATSTPLTIGLPVLFLKIFRGIPYIFEVRDLWPEVPIQMGAIKNKQFIYFLELFEKIIYQNSCHIVALSPGMADGVKKYNGLPGISMIPNMSKVDVFFPRDIDKSLYQELGLNENTFKIVHFGAMGKANGVQSILESAKLMLDYPEIEFILIGGGSEERELQNFCLANGLKNVIFLGRYPMSKLSDIVNICDVSLVSFSDIPILYTNSPNKLFDSLSAGKPILVNSAGWTKDLVEKHNCGFYYDPGDPASLVTIVNSMFQNRATLKTMGANSRELALTKYDKSILTKQFADLVTKHIS